MNSNKILRLLCLFSFLLLIAPFYDQCNGKGIRDIAVEAPVTEESSPIDESLNIQKVDSTSINDSISNNDLIVNDTIAQVSEKKSVFQKAYEFIDNGDNQNGFELAFMFIHVFEQPFSKTMNEIKGDFTKGKFDNLFFLIRSFSFVVIVMITFLIFILSFFKRFRLIYKLSFCNFIFIIISLICIIFFDTFFETFKQIKWGFYTFILFQVGILIYSKKILKVDISTLEN